MVSQWNDDSIQRNISDLSDTTFLDDIVLSYCVSTPSKIAIRFKDKNISYGELGHTVTCLAQQLIDNGVQSGDFVVVLLDPSEHIIYSLLAITHIGAIYTPLDPTNPDVQLAEKYQSTQAIYTITQQQYESRAQQWARQAIVIDRLRDMSETEITLTANKERSIDAPACIFFTSGTTGKAKGVLGSARALRNAIVSPAQHLEFTNEDTLNSIARYAWSISMLELIAPLTFGGTTLILDPKQALDLEWLKMQVESCTTFHCPPALLRKFARHIQQTFPNDQSFDHIRLVWYGGDTFSPSHIDTLQRVFPNAVIGTAYGCTEIFGLSHIHFYPRQKTERVLIGQPVQGIEQLICDENYKPVAKGQQGEILLAGDRVAIEYWQDPELNAEKFITIDDERYFLTGDYALLHESGDLEFLQRKDSQVKIRGIRIELGEIEQTLNALDIVQEAIVLAIETNTEERELRAYLVTKNNDDNIVSLRSAIKNNLPDYMMPAKWFLLDALPVTENFKINRKALAKLEPENDKPPTLEGTVGQIAEVWLEITGRSPTDISDNFFECGGDSLAAIQLVVKLSQKFNIKIEVADIYRHPTLQGQANIFSEEATYANADPNNLAPLNSTDNSLPTPVYATKGQVGLFFREMLSHKGYSITCTRHVFSPQLFNEQWVKQALNILVERYPTLRTNIKISRPNLELIENKYSIDDMIFVRMQPGWSLAADAERPLTKHMHKFDVSKDPLLCAIASPMKEGGEMLQLTSHHIACDDNSLGRVAREFLSLYDSLKTNSDIRLHTVKDDYMDFAQQQFNAITSGAYSQRASVVADRLMEILLEGQNEALLTPANTSKKSSSHFKKQLQINLNNAVFAHYIAALSWAFYKIWGRTDFVFCAHSALRRDSDNVPIVGMYINLLPVITGYNPEHDISQHISRTVVDFNEAMSRSDIPYEVILDENEALKKRKKFPFDAFINELSFVEEFPSEYKNETVPEAFATNTDEINVTVVDTLNGKFLHLESPSVETIEYIHNQVFDLMREFLIQVTQKSD